MCPRSAFSIHLACACLSQFVVKWSLEESCVRHSNNVTSPPNLRSSQHSVMVRQVTSRENLCVLDLVLPGNF